jgi:hypothetical protein
MITPAGVFTLSGKNSTTKIRSFTGALNSTREIIAASCTVVQVGFRQCFHAGIDADRVRSRSHRGLWHPESDTLCLTITRDAVRSC